MQLQLICVVSLVTSAVLLSVQCELHECESLPSEDFIYPASRQFALDLFKNFNEEDNAFISPLAVLVSLGATLVRTCKNSAAQIKWAMALSRLKDENVHDGFRKIILDLQKQQREQNFLWGSRIFGKSNTSPKRINELSTKFRYGQLFRVDFEHSVIEAVNAINDWASKRTRGSISNIVNADEVKYKTGLLLATVVFLRPDWQKEFNTRDTNYGMFTTLSGIVMEVPMMVLMDSEIEYGESDELACQMVRLPFSNKRMAMTILLPYNGQTVSDLQRKLKVESLTRIHEDMRKQGVKVMLPKFTINNRALLKNGLRHLGIEDIFSPEKSDFCESKGTKTIFVNDVVHQAVIEVNESGTNSGLATEVSSHAKNRFIPNFIEFKANRPFVFLIQDDVTGVPIFIGRVVIPNADLPQISSSKIIDPATEYTRFHQQALKTSITTTSPSVHPTTSPSVHPTTSPSVHPITKPLIPVYKNGNQAGDMSISSMSGWMSMKGIAGWLTRS